MSSATLSEKAKKGYFPKCVLLKEKHLGPFWKLKLCSVPRSSTGSAMTWPRSTWTVWRSDSSYPSLLVPSSRRRCGAWIAASWISGPPAPESVYTALVAFFFAMLGWNVVCHKDWLRTLTGQLVTNHWHALSAFPRRSDPTCTLRCHFTSAKPEGPLNRGAGLIFYVTSVKAAGPLYTSLTGFKERRCFMPYYKQTLKRYCSRCQPLGDVLSLFVTL